MAFITSELKDGPFIPCTVIDYADNDQFIIAIQQWIKDCGYDSEAAKNSGNTYNFWIIDLRSNQLIGPLSIEEYVHKRAELQIPEDLKVELTI